MPYREPDLRPPARPTWTPADVALLAEALLDRGANGVDNVWSRLARARLAVRLAAGLLAGMLLGAVTGVVIAAVGG